MAVRPIKPEILAFLEEHEVPHPECDGFVIRVGGREFSGTPTNTVGKGSILTTLSASPKDLMPVLGGRIINNSYTITFSLIKGTVFMNSMSAPSMTLMCTGSESPWGAVVHAHLIAMALHSIGNPSIPYNLHPIHVTISVKPIIFTGELIDLDIVFAYYRQYMEVVYNPTDLNCLKIQLGGDADSVVTCSIYNTGKAVAAGTPPGDWHKYAALITRILLHMHWLTAGKGARASRASASRTRAPPSSA